MKEETVKPCALGAFTKKPIFHHFLPLQSLPEAATKCWQVL